MPPLVGWAAVTGNLTLTAFILFAIVFVWTPPHFWALALLIRRDYEAAGIPMLPVVRGQSETTRQIVRYSVLMIAVTLLPIAAGVAGWGYGGAALALGGALPVVRGAPAPPSDAASGASALPLLAALPRPGLRRRGDRRQRLDDWFHAAARLIARL